MGAVVVKGGKLKGAGFHRRAGEPHAEVLALHQAATLGADLVVLGGSRRKVLVNLLRGDTVQQVSNSLPEEIRLVVVG